MPGVNLNRDRPTLRERQKQATTAAVLDAARSLFRQSGFAAVTVSRIAEEAGVSPETVYQRFGTKAGLLHEMIQRAVRQDAGHPGTGIPALVQSMLEEGDPLAQVDRWAALGRHVNQAAWDLFDVTRAAASVDAATAARWESEQQWRYEAQEKLARSLSDKGALSADIPEKVAADLLWTWCGHDLYRELVVERGWTPAAYEVWIARTCRKVLLRDQLH